MARLRTPLFRPVRAAGAATALKGLDALRWAAFRNHALFRAVGSAPSDILDDLSADAAWRIAKRSMRSVPAYRAFLERSGWTDDPSLSVRERVARLPVMDKNNYIREWSTQMRCNGGTIPMRGTEIDESSGASGVPYNWVRSKAELHDVHLSLSHFAHYLLGSNAVTINGFSMGAWSTGINAAAALRRNGMVKSPGPDMDKIIDTLRFLGRDYLYVITGYPPFLRDLLLYGDSIGFEWSEYRMVGMVGGEGMSEQLRASLETRFSAVYSAYGASDLDIGVAAETPLSIWLRKHANANRELREALFGNDSRLPMIFQHNPADYYVEVNECDELIITVNRTSVLSPRIRYNIHDSGGILDFKTTMNVLRDFGLDGFADVGTKQQPIFRLPFLFLRGRSDSTVSFMGANIYPEDVEQGLYAGSTPEEGILGFCLELVDVDGDARPCVHVELRDVPVNPEAFAIMLGERVRDQLIENSRDFRAAVAENSNTAEITVKLHVAGAGPFAENTKRIKRRYVVTS